MKIVHKDYSSNCDTVMRDSIELLNHAAARCYHMAVDWYLVHSRKAPLRDDESLIVHPDKIRELNVPAIALLLDTQNVLEEILDRHEEQPT